MKIDIYGSATCIPCKNTKRYLDKKHIPYIYHDITTDEVARDYIEFLGYNSIPVIVVNDKEHWSGYQPDKLNQLGG